MHSYRTSAELNNDPGVPRLPDLKVRKEKRRRCSVRANLATDPIRSVSTARKYDDDFRVDALVASSFRRDARRLARCAGDAVCRERQDEDAGGGARRRESGCVRAQQDRCVSSGCLRALPSL